MIWQAEIIECLQAFVDRPNHQTFVWCFEEKEKNQSFVWFFCLCDIPYLPGQAKDCPAGITVRWTVIVRKNLLLLQEASYVGIPYLPGQANVLSCRNNRPLDGYRQKKPPAIAGGFLCWHYLSSRAVARQVLSAYMSLTSVFGMGTGGPS